jgi:ribose transport system ATP-binding protein
VGAGRSELAQLIFGVRKATGGMIEVDGEPVVIHSPRAAIDNGIGFLTENRKEQGLFLELAAQENITMATLERDATFGMLNRKKPSPSPMMPSPCSIFAFPTPRCGRVGCPAGISKSC